MICLTTGIDIPRRALMLIGLARNLRALIGRATSLNTIGQEEDQISLMLLHVQEREMGPSQIMIGAAISLTIWPTWLLVRIKTGPRISQRTQIGMANNPVMTGIVQDLISFEQLHAQDSRIMIGKAISLRT
jgi:hypothetical protein